MFYIIIFIVVFWLCYSILNNFKKRKEKKKSEYTKSYTIDIDISPKTINQIQKALHNPDISRRIEMRNKRLEIRGARLDRHRRIWSVLFLSNSFYEIEDRMKKGYPTKKMLQNLENAKSAVKENKPTQSDIKTAIRFCQIEYARGKCPHQLTDSDIETITNIYTVAQLPPPYTS